jgi:hypothetical protein
MFDSLLTLDKSTLFFWTLSDSSLSKKRKYKSDTINNWAAEVPCTAAPSSHTHSNTTAPTISRHSVPSLTSGTSRSHSSGGSKAHSNQTDNVKISRAAVGLAKVNAEPALAKMINIMSNGGLSDNDEINGEEQLATVQSPFKGKARVTSEVSSVWVMCWVVIIITELLSSNL